MANEATAELYRRQSGLNKAKLNTDYEQYLADLATKYGISNDQLNANLESRGILRSGEAGTAQARLAGANEAARTSAKTTYDYNTATEDVNLMTQLAGLQSGSGSGGGTTPTPTTPTPTTPRPTTPTPTTPTNPPVYDFSKVDFAGLAKWGAQIEKDKKAKAQIAAAPGYNWSKVKGWG
jgi:hypothetical protein